MPQVTNLSYFSFLSPPFPISSPHCLPLQWQAISLTVIEKVQIAAAILGSLFLIASISWLIWSTFSPSAKWQRQDLLFQICYGMYGFMDIVCIGGLSHLTAWPRSPTRRSICVEEWEMVWRASRHSSAWIGHPGLFLLSAFATPFLKSSLLILTAPEYLLV